MLEIFTHFLSLKKKNSSENQHKETIKTTKVLKNYLKTKSISSNLFLPMSYFPFYLL